MADFSEVREQLRRSREQKEQARLALFAAQERSKKIEAQLAGLQRHFDARNPAHTARRKQLLEQRAGAERDVEKNRAVFARFQGLEREHFKAFVPLSDPRKSVSLLSDSLPFLLLPVRLETRFKQIARDGGVQHQLWVRIYPDECAIDSFEPMLSEAELTSARIYWAELWQAGGIEAQERSAWRRLVASHGSGRAYWIVQHYQPLNLDDKPAKAEATDVVLVIETESPLSAKEQTATAAFWRAIWLAAGDESQSAAARTNLVAAVGEARAGEIIANYVPRNLDEVPAPPKQREDVAVSVAFVVFAANDDTATKQHSWTQAPRVEIFPERFVLIGYAGGAKVFEVIGNAIPSPLVAGPDPSASPDEQIRQQDGDLVISDEMKWMVDFDRAIEWGLGFKIDLTEAQARAGFDRVLALGVHLGADAAAGQAKLESLLQHHQQSRSGFSLLPQGTPTNNTESSTSGFSHSDDADASFDDYFKKDALFEETDDWRLKQDGQWLAELLGIDPAVLRKVRHSDGTDQCEARAMQTVLWPATFGYMMETMMPPVFSDDTIESTRWFFNHFVSGRGIMPAIRIGSQPYGILPATPFSRLGWIEADNWSPIARLPHPENYRVFLRQLYHLLRRMSVDWREMAGRVARVGKPGDAHQILLDILGLHPASVEFHQRMAESLEHLFNRLNLDGLGGAFLAALIAAGYVESGRQLLRKLGYEGEAMPEVLQKFFLTAQNKLKGPVIDDRPLSEIEVIRSYTDDGKNYIAWLIEAARTSLESIRLQQGFTENKAPTALLYILLRHALMQGYWDTSLRLHVEAELLPIENLAAVKREAPFVHVRAQAETSESRWAHLYKAEPRITGERGTLVAEFIPRILGELPAARYLTEQIEALAHLEQVPTARLERLFAEHIDCCSNRLDAWQLGLLHYQLATMRYQRRAAGAVPGLYLGAYGWLENVRPENKTLTPVQLPPDLEDIFKAKESPIFRDSSNGGYIHAPSLNHAVTAAVLRNGYLANASPANRQTLAVNLSSARVRVALSVLEAIRGGQSLGALLGYQFERGLHDRHNLAEVDQFIFKMRKVFPLRADHLNPTQTPADVPIEAIEARNVLDGLRLVEHLKKSSVKTYPFGKDLPPATPAQAAAINAEVDRLLDIHDAVADLALAEGVHQAVQGNFDRAAGTLETYSQGNFPPEPAVVQTPRSGIVLTHRAGLQLEAGLDSTVSPLPGVPTVTPRALAEPALNKWLAQILPPPEKIGVKVTYTDAGTGDEIAKTVTQQDLQLQPIDLLFLVQPDQQQAMTELDDRVARYIIATFAPRPDQRITIRYTEKGSEEVSFFACAPLLRSLRALALRSRPLRATDIALTNEARTAQDEAVFVDAQRLLRVKTAMGTLHTGLSDFHNELEALFADPVANRAAILAAVDNALERTVSLSMTAAGFGLPQTGWGFAFDWKQQTFSELLQQVRDLIARWQPRLDAFDGLIDDYDDQATDVHKFDLLQQAERLISTATTVMPSSLDAYKTQVLAKRDAFAARLQQFRDLAATTQTSISGPLSQLGTLLPIDAFDLAGFDLEAAEAKVIAFVEELMLRAGDLATEVDRRLKAAQAQFDLHDGTAVASAKVAAMQQAAQILLGDDFQIIPEFQPSPEQGDEWQQAWQAGTSGDVLSHLGERDFPVDDWLYGIARVRDKMRHWEQVVMLASGFGTSEARLQLQPLQLPFKAGDTWLGLEFPQDYSLDGDRLLYTTHYAVPFQKTQRQCGLLIDEWTEVIPGTGETTGLAFHYDRPNTEPPQTMLLVTPASFTGAWQWQDLVDALHETLALAQQRAVEPVHIDNTPYVRFLPATVMAATLYQISITANLAINNKMYDFVRSDEA